VRLSALLVYEDVRTVVFAVLHTFDMKYGEMYMIKIERELSLNALNFLLVA